MTPSAFRRPRPTPIQPPQRPARVEPPQDDSPLDTGASSLALFIAVAGLSFVVGSLVTLQFAPIDARAGTSGLSTEVTRGASTALAPLGESTRDPSTAMTGDIIAALVSTAIRHPLVIAAELPSRRNTQLAVSALTHTSLGLRPLSETAAHHAAAQGQLQTLTETAVGDLTRVRLAATQDSAAAVPAEAIEALVEEAAAPNQAATEAQPQPEVEIINGQRYYTVDRGDSLAYIALIFFGDTGAYQQIYEANRDVLETPDHVEVGMRLRIPDA